jgi:hypothetical protein
VTLNVIYIAISLGCVIVAFLFGWREGYVSARREMRMARGHEVIAAALPLKARLHADSRPARRSGRVAEPPSGRECPLDAASRIPEEEVEMADELARLGAFLTAHKDVDGAVVNIAVDSAGDFMVACQWGDRDDPESSGAMYGTGQTIDGAVNMALEHARA